MYRIGYWSPAGYPRFIFADDAESESLRLTQSGNDIASITRVRKGEQ